MKWVLRIVAFVVMPLILCELSYRESPDHILSIAAIVTGLLCFAARRTFKLRY